MKKLVASTGTNSTDAATLLRTTRRRVANDGQLAARSRSRRRS